MTVDPDGAGPFGGGFAAIQLPTPVTGTVEVYFTVSTKCPFGYHWNDVDGDGTIDNNEIFCHPDPTAAPFEGAFEWVVVGRDSHPVDSAAAAMVVEAVHEGVLHPDSDPRVVQYSGLDMQHVNVWVPYLMREFSAPATGPRGNYYFAGLRAALKGDWANLEPVSSSSVIAVGGPGANLVAEYFNSLAPVIYAGGSAHYSLGNTPYRFVAPGLWIDQTLLSDPSLGVVFAYRDLNGNLAVLLPAHSN